MTENRNKKPYQTTKIELLYYTSNDIITTSSGNDSNNSLGGDGDGYDSGGWT